MKRRASRRLSVCCLMLVCCVAGQHATRGTGPPWLAARHSMLGGVRCYSRYVNNLPRTSPELAHTGLAVRPTAHTGRGSHRAHGPWARRAIVERPPHVCTICLCGRRLRHTILLQPCFPRLYGNHPPPSHGVGGSERGHRRGRPKARPIQGVDSLPTH